MSLNVKNMRRLDYILLCSFVVACLSSCSNKYWYCSIDSIGHAPMDKSYFIEKRFPSDVHPLVTDEYVQDLEIILDKLGYVKTDSTSANLKVAFGFDLSGKSDRAFISSNPVYFYNPIAPIFSYAGQSTRTRYITFQDIELRIDAFEVSTRTPVYSVSIMAEETKQDIQNLRKYMPLYLLNAMPYIGNPTIYRGHSKVSFKDKRIKLWFPMLYKTINQSYSEEEIYPNKDRFY